MTKILLAGDVWDLFVSNEKFLTKMETSWAKRLIAWTDYRTQKFPATSYLNYVLSLNLAKQKPEVQFLINTFECLGVKLNFFEKRYFLNKKGEKVKDVESRKRKKALATDREISDFLDLLDGKEKLAVQIMVSSGRRAVDVGRISAKCTYLCMILK